MARGLQAASTFLCNEMEDDLNGGPTHYLVGLDRLPNIRISFGQSALKRRKRRAPTAWLRLKAAFRLTGTRREVQVRGVLTLSSPLVGRGERGAAGRVRGVPRAVAALPRWVVSARFCVAHPSVCVAHERSVVAHRSSVGSPGSLRVAHGRLCVAPESLRVAYGRFCVAPDPFRVAPESFRVAPEPFGGTSGWFGNTRSSRENTAVPSV